MLEGMNERLSLLTLARLRARSGETISVTGKQAAEYENAGWSVVRVGKAITRLQRPKSALNQLIDRFWTLFFKMEFSYLPEGSSVILPPERKQTDGTIEDLQILAIDDEMAIAMRFHTGAENLPEKIQTFAEIRARVARAIHNQWPNESKRQVVLAFVVDDSEIDVEERELARALNVITLSPADLDYYEKLAAHVGPAAKYQLFADMAPGKTIPGLEIRVPAVRSKMGKYNCYTFPIAPEYLLKIAYVSHRSKGKASDVHTYQRMVGKNRLNNIRRYITEQGIFPTNIVVNLEKKCIDFQKGRQEGGSDDADLGGVSGWLKLRPAYKSAWIIDGQHRLFAFSGHARARSSHLSVLAFEGIPPSAQARLFVDINAKQKSVKPSLLQELYAELHWDADSPTVRTQAIISKIAQALNVDRRSALFGRVQSADSTKDSLRCISLASLFKAIERQGFFVVKEQHNEVTEAGPLWADSNEATMNRAIIIIGGWLNLVREKAADWWDLGSAEGGGLAMNDSVTACISLLKSVFFHLDSSGTRLRVIPNKELLQAIQSYGQIVSIYLSSLSLDERKKWRDLRGSQGQIVRTRRLQQVIRDSVPSFNPPGLEEHLELEKQQNNLKAKQVIDEIEVTLKTIVFETLKSEFRNDPNAWWDQGIPKTIRLEVVKRQESDDNKRGDKESYFDLIDYRNIAQANWTIFSNLLGFGDKPNSSKDKRTKWLAEVNELRNQVAHASSGVILSAEAITILEGHLQSLHAQQASLDETTESCTEADAEETENW